MKNSTCHWFRNLKLQIMFPTTLKLKRSSQLVTLCSECSYFLEVALNTDKLAALAGQNVRHQPNPPPPLYAI